MLLEHNLEWRDDDTIILALLSIENNMQEDIELLKTQMKK
jgi:hypothetical protein